MLETQNFIETRDHESNGNAPFETVLFDLEPNSSFIGTVTIRAVNMTTLLPVRKIIDVSGLQSDSKVLFDGEVAENLRAQVIVGNADLKVVVWDNSVQARPIQWQIVGNIDQMWSN